MPASYQWNIRGTQCYEESFYEGSRGKVSLGFFWHYDTEKLNEVDRIICDVMRETPHPTLYNRYYNELIELAFTSLMKFGGQFVETHHVMWMEHIVNKLTPEQLSEAEKIRMIMLVRWAFLDKWKFEAWR